MHLLTKDIFETSELFITEFLKRFDVPLSELYAIDSTFKRLSGEGRKYYSQAIDLSAAGWIAARSQTFLFNVDQAVQFMRSIDRRLSPGNYAIPFYNISLQFTKGIDEKLFTSGLKPEGDIDESDEIAAILVSFPQNEDGVFGRYINIVAWYKSTSINRVQLPILSDGSIDYNPLYGDAADPVRQKDKQRIANLAMHCIAYITSPSVEIEHVETPAAVNRKRARDGKRELPDYYICKLRKTKNASDSSRSATGTKHSFRYDVAGHIRIMADGTMIHVKPHQRGVSNELYKPKIYRVD